MKMGDEGIKFARETFAKNAAFYHPIAKNMIKKDIELE